MNKDITNIFNFLLAGPDNSLIFLVIDPRGNGLNIFIAATGTPQSCVIAFLGMEGLASTLGMQTPPASALHKCRVVHHSDPKLLHELGWAIVDAAAALGYELSTSSVPRNEPMRLGQAWYLRLKDGRLEFTK